MHIPYGQQTPPTMNCAVGFICEIEFAPGETVFDRVAGDKNRWKFSTGFTGEDRSIPTLFIEPKDYCDRNDSGKCDGPLQTNLLVTTNKHTYEVVLLAVKHTDHSRYAFYDPAIDVRQRALMRAAAAAHAAMSSDGGTAAPIAAATPPLPRVSTYELAMTNIEAGITHKGPFDYGYRIVGTTPFRPSSVWNDGLHTYLQIDPRAQAVTWQAEDTHGNAYLPVVHPPIAGVYTVDGVPNHIWLIQDVGKHVPQIDIYHGDWK
jgi:type IV secretion system protein VirB9